MIKEIKFSNGNLTQGGLIMNRHMILRKMDSAVEHGQKASLFKSVS